MKPDPRYTPYSELQSKVGPFIAGLLIFTVTASALFVSAILLISAFGE